MARVIKNETLTVTSDSVAARPSLTEALKYRNVVFGSLAMVGFLSSLHTLSAFMPNYLTDHIGLSMQRMGFVMSSLGAGGVLGMILIPALSDRLGRKSVMLVALLLAISALFTLTRLSEGAMPISLCLFLISATISGVVAITIGPFVNASVPPRIAATATGIVAGIGEIAGGALAPAIAGVMAETQDISIIPYISLIAALFALALVLFGIREPQRDGLEL